jgi:hypothetical protein
LVHQDVEGCGRKGSLGSVKYGVWVIHGSDSVADGENQKLS